MASFPNPPFYTDPLIKSGRGDERVFHPQWQDWFIKVAQYITATGGYGGGILPATSGGTGFGTYAVGDLLYASTTSALNRLADVATGNALISGGVGVAPTWGKINLASAVTGILPVANGGTATSTAFTAGSVVFAGASGTYTQDNANIFWDDANNRLGVGTASPIARLHVGTGAGSGSLRDVCYISDTISPVAFGSQLSVRDGTVNAAANNNAANIFSAGTLVAASSGTHAIFAGLRVAAPTITTGASTITEASTFRIDGAAAGATANYALHVAAGESRFGGTVTCTTKFYPPTDAAAAQTACALYAGTGAPNNANGANGDYYFRSDGGVATHIYFKAAGAWAGII